MKTIFTLLRLLILLGLIVMMTAIDSRSQDRWGVQVRPGVSFATTDLGDANLKTGFGFDVAASYRFMPHTSVYIGWGWNRFSSDRSFAGDNMDFEETGYILGLQFAHPFAERLPFGYFLKGGALYNHIEVENTAGDIISDSGHGFGFQVETGLSFSVSESWHIIPGIKYQSLSRDLEINETNYAVDLNYLSVGITLLKSF
ncbi:MAG TPA: outer membrane beta-barrel protein [Chryseosolibacter sp.]